MPDSRPIFRPIVPVYDLLNRVLSLGLDQSWRRHLARRLPSGRVLDLACGTGDLAFAAASMRSDGEGRIFGADILPEMLVVAARKNAARKNAARKNAARKNAARARFASTDGCVAAWTAAAGERLPFRPASFDALMIAFGIRNFLDRAAGLQEMARVVKPGGRVFILEFALPDSGPVRALYLFYFTRLLPLIGRLISGNNASYSYLPASVLEFPPPDEFASEIRSAGFERVDITAFTFGIVRLYEASRHANQDGDVLKSA